MTYPYSFPTRIRALEERLFAGELSGHDPKLMKNQKDFWLYRPSHHIATGLITEEDIELLKKPDRRLLSVGACPAYLERLLIELGVPADNILVADNDPALSDIPGPIQKIIFDMNEAWPLTGTFDRIIFPESLCISISDRMREDPKPVTSSEPHPTDARESELLAAILRQALERLKPGGIIRANGPMSHPNVMALMSRKLQEKGLTPVIDCQRFFLKLQPCRSSLRSE